MQRARNKGGRPSKGDRMSVSARLPSALALALRAEAERRDVAYSDVLADALAARYGQPSYLPLDGDQMIEEQMKLPA